jgi:hypothetical protein
MDFPITFLSFFEHHQLSTILYYIYYTFISNQPEICRYPSRYFPSEKIQPKNTLCFPSVHSPVPRLVRSRAPIPLPLALQLLVSQLSSDPHCSRSPSSDANIPLSPQLEFCANLPVKVHILQIQLKRMLMANNPFIVDVELSEKLAEELSHEQSSGEMDEPAEVIKAYFEGSTWEVCTGC